MYIINNGNKGILNILKCIGQPKLYLTLQMLGSFQNRDTF